MNAFYHENQMRQYVYEVVQPLIKRSAEMKEQLNLQKEMIQLDRKNIEDMKGHISNVRKIDESQSI